MLRRVLASLLLGVVVTILVAWGRTLAFPNSRFVCTTGPGAVLLADSTPAWCVGHYRHPTMVWVISSVVTDEDELQRLQAGWQPYYDRWPDLQGHPGLEIPKWSRPARLSAAEATSGAASSMESVPSLSETAAGWPRLALRAAWTPSNPAPGPVTVVRGIRIPWDWNDPQRNLSASILPTSPIWPGFITDSALYALAAFPILSARAWKAAWLARRRQCRGLCGSCGYPLGEAANCPECGASRAGVAHAQIARM